MSTVSSAQAVEVLIVDDHPFMRRGLAQMIKDFGAQLCGESATVAEAMETLRSALPDLVILDISLPDGNGLELAKEIKAQWPETKILISSMHDETIFAERALRAGALGYINKSDDVEQFQTALRRVLSGRVYLSPRMTERLLSRVAGGDEDESPLERLTDRELEVFEMIGRGLGTKEIAATLDLSPKTVETHREHIKSKLQLKNGIELTRHAIQWVLEQTPVESANHSGRR